MTRRWRDKANRRSTFGSNETARDSRQRSVREAVTAQLRKTFAMLRAWPARVESRVFGEARWKKLRPHHPAKFQLRPKRPRYHRNREADRKLARRHRSRAMRQQTFASGSVRPATSNARKAFRKLESSFARRQRDRTKRRAHPRIAACN